MSLSFLAPCVWCVPPMPGISCVLSGISGHYMLILRRKFAHFMPKICPFYTLATYENTQQGCAPECLQNSSSSSTSSWKISCLWLFLTSISKSFITIIRAFDSKPTLPIKTPVVHIFPKGPEIQYFCRHTCLHNQGDAGHYHPIQWWVLVKPGPPLVTCLCQGAKGLRWAQMGSTDPVGKKGDNWSASRHLPLSGSALSGEKCKSKLFCISRSWLPSFEQEVKTVTEKIRLCFQMWEVM